jgi:hypothetical protein
MFGAVMSLFTGKADDLPQWNGVSYMVFCAKEGFLFGAIVAFPVALICCFILLLIRKRNGK